MKLLRRYFIAGLLFWVPIWVTILIITFLVDIIGGTVSLLPKAYQPEQLLGFHIPGLNFLLVIILILITGALVANFLGNFFIGLWDRFINKIPLVRTIYSGAKQILETVFTPQGKAFRKVLLVQYPRQGLWSIAFQTGDVAKEISDGVERDMITIFVPTTPNPTSGFLMMISKEDAKELSMTVDQALKLVISLGVVQPQAKDKQKTLQTESK